MNSLRLEPIDGKSLPNTSSNGDATDPDSKKKRLHLAKNINIPLPGINLDIDLNKLNKVFDSYATKKTIATGFFNLALVATNFAQMKYLIAKAIWTGLNITLLTFVCLSLFLQFALGTLLVFLAKQGEFIDEEKRDQLIRSNNWATLIALAISIINIFINVFLYGF